MIMVIHGTEYYLYFCQRRGFVFTLRRKPRRPENRRAPCRPRFRPHSQVCHLSHIQCIYTNKQNKEFTYVQEHISKMSTQCPARARNRVISCLHHAAVCRIRICRSSPCARRRRPPSMRTWWCTMRPDRGDRESNGHPRSTAMKEP